MPRNKECSETVLSPPWKSKLRNNTNGCGSPRKAKNNECLQIVKTSIKNKCYRIPIWNHHLGLFWFARHQISAKRGPDSRFIVEANTKCPWPKSSRSQMVNLMDCGRIWLDSTCIHHIRLKYRYSTCGRVKLWTWLKYGWIWPKIIISFIFSIFGHIYPLMFVIVVIFIIFLVMFKS